MKTMQNFAAQQLTKKQMNEVKGGAIQSNLCNDGLLLYTCVITYKGGVTSSVSDCSNGPGTSSIRIWRAHILQESADLLASINCS